MKKISSFLFLFSCVFASLQDRFETEILSLDPKENTVVFNAKDLKVGESGIVVTKLTDYAGIIAQVEVLRCCQDNKAVAQIKPFEALKQIYLPTPNIKPKEGDRVVFRSFNQKAFLVAPNLEFYERIKEEYKDFDFLSSDLLLGYLFSYGEFDPSKLFFKKACNAYSAGLLFVVNRDTLDILDCQSFKILDSKKLDTSKVEDTQIPFYSRIDEIKSGTLFSFLQSKKARYYFAYYTNLLHPNIPYQPIMLEEKQKLDKKKLEELKLKEAKKQEEKRKKKEEKENKKNKKENKD
ncbi:MULTISPECIES: plasminogen-binding N-terminal domain-containing protein [unclassified Helicobacter]|uniref:plasminogen-binding N-terminal domain-containing protein n=1 Tax=unclassified Helicobacter TaxID=2593540 RepID=UPI000CF0647D|nr:MULTISPECIES: plasminogen-binding N-terminal domain-containing protein [unclassified Helicobacter]